jgi:peptidoglycan/LPS O-acetylase OafA/YrhL
MVLAAHLVGLWTGTVGFTWVPWQLYLGGIDLLRVDHQAGGHAGLLLFFLVSGYIVSQAAEGESRRAFIVKRAARLLPAMVLAVALAVFVGWFGPTQGWPPMVGFAPDRALSGWSLLEAVGLGATFGGIAALFVLWSLSVEYYWYAMLATGIGASTRRPVAITWVGIGVVLLLHQLARFVDGPVYLVADHLSYVFVIIIGRWIYLRHRGAATTSVTLGGSLVALGLYGWTLWPTAGTEVFSGAHPRLLAVVWAAALFLLLLRLVRSGPWRPVAFVADISYGLYLFHLPVMFLVLPLVSPEGQMFPVGLLLTVVTTVGLAWLSMRFVETPVRRAARRLLHRRSDEPVVSTAAAGG